MTARRPLLLAHRGDHRAVAENSVAAMREAVAVAGCDGLEFDLQAARDGTPVVIHDETLLRTHGRPDRVDALDFDALRQLGVPTLEDVLAVIPDDRFLDVELKADVAAAVAAPLVARLERGGRLIVSSFEPAMLVAIRSAAPVIERWLNSETLDETVARRAVDLACSTVSVALAAIDRASAAIARSAGLEVAAWTATTRSELERLGEVGVVAICVEGDALEG